MGGIAFSIAYGIAWLRNYESSLGMGVSSTMMIYDAKTLAPSVFCKPVHLCLLGNSCKERSGRINCHRSAGVA
jgi:hypothetical protein